MKKFVRKSLAMLLAVIMASSAFGMLFATAATITTGVEYESASGYHTITFNPSTSGFIAVPYANDYINRQTLNNLYTSARTEYIGTKGVDKFAGGINGSYFDMTTGSLNGTNITNGKIKSWVAPWDFVDSSGVYYEPFLAFGYDGSITPIDSHINASAVVSGLAFNDSIITINHYPASVWDDTMYYFDENINGVSTASTRTITMASSGRYVIVNKDNVYTELSIGIPLTGTIASIVDGTSCTITGDQFALFMKGTNYFTTSQVGDAVSVTAEESYSAESAEVLENAIGVVQRTGTLVKDGATNFTTSDPLNIANGYCGDHSAYNYNRAWTGIGIKADGTIIMMISTGSSSDMEDMANRMIALGCTQGYRMDSGGSTSMMNGTTYLAIEEQRPVTEGIFIANTAYMGNDEVSAELSRIIGLVEEKLDNVSVAVLDEAKAALNATNPIAAQQKRYIGELLSLLTSRGLLGALVDGISLDTLSLSDYKADILQTALIEANRIVANVSSTDYECETILNVITSGLSGSYDGDRVSLGAAYATSDVNSAYPDNGGKELTDGDLYEIPGGSSHDRWMAFTSDNAGGSNSKGTYSEVYIDMGEETEISGVSVSARNRTDWGITAPVSMELLTSNDGKNFTYACNLYCGMAVANGVDQALLYHNQSSATARYFVVRIYFSGTHSFIGEVSLYGNEDVEYSTVDRYNDTNWGEDVIFYTEGTYTSSNSNCTWSHTVVCEYTNGQYVVTSSVENAGNSAYSYTVPSGGFMISYHGSRITDQIKAIEVGDIAYINGIHHKVTSPYSDPAARVTFKAPNSLKVGSFDVMVGVISAGNGLAASDDDYIRLYDGITVAQLISVSSDKGITVKVNGQTVSGNTVLGNNAVVTDSNGNEYITYIFADATGDDNFSVADYMMVKRAFMGLADIDGLELKASCVSGGASIRAIDYVIIKRYFMGTYIPA